MLVSLIVIKSEYIFEYMLRLVLVTYMIKTLPLPSNANLLLALLAVETFSFFEPKTFCNIYVISLLDNTSALSLILQ
jgi:hypothetical protein